MSLPSSSTLPINHHSTNEENNILMTDENEPPMKSEESKRFALVRPWEYSPERPKKENITLYPFAPFNVIPPVMPLDLKLSSNTYSPAITSVPYSSEMIMSQCTLGGNRTTASPVPDAKLSIPPQTFQDGKLPEIIISPPSKSSNYDSPMNQMPLQNISNMSYENEMPLLNMNCSRSSPLLPNLNISPIPRLSPLMPSVCHLTSSNLPKLTSSPSTNLLAKPEQSISRSPPPPLINIYNRTTEATPSPSVFKSSPQLIEQHYSFLDELNRLQFSPMTESWARECASFYCRQVELLEMQRYQSLIRNITSVECKQAIQTFYDAERMQLLKRMRKKLQDQPSPAMFLQLHAPITPPTTPPTKRQRTPKMKSSTPMQWYPSFKLCQNNTSSFNGQANDSGYDSYVGTPSSSPTKASPLSTADAQNNGSAKNRKFLNHHAVELMEDWYRQNFDHPYPNDSIVTDLATRGQITATQVKKWMANKRVRSFNTLSFNGSIHPKKLKRLQRQQNLCSMQLSRMIENEEIKQENKAPLEQEMVAPPPPRARHVPLSSSAVGLLSEWFQNHKDDPYPSEQDKMDLMVQTDLTLTQIQCWFSNKRSRTSAACKVPDTYVLDLFKNRSESIMESYHEQS